jgi:hypothetical protein
MVEHAPEGILGVLIHAAAYKFTRSGKGAGPQKSWLDKKVDEELKKARMEGAGR